MLEEVSNEVTAFAQGTDCNYDAFDAINSLRTLRLRGQLCLMRPDSEPGATVSQILQDNSLLKGLRRDIDTISKESLAPRKLPWPVCRTGLETLALTMALS